jgi:phosphatidylglycerol lysyltransferase
VSDPERQRVLALLVRYGWNATSFQVLEPGFRYFWDGDDACVAYVDTGAAWVTAGAPLAKVERFDEVMERFCSAARGKRRRVCCFATEMRFHEAVAWPALRIGDQPVWVPEDWDAALQSRRSLREQLRRARAKGVVVRRLAAPELVSGSEVRVRLERLIARWQRSRAMAPMGFLVQVDPFTFLEERRQFVAEHNGLVVGFLGIVPVYARRGWFFEDFLRDPEAPNGTVELLVDAGMRAAVDESVPYVTLGLVPLAGEVGPFLRLVKSFGQTLYDFDGLRGFKAKFAPRHWEPIHLAHPPDTYGLLAVRDVLTAFARGGLTRFGIETLLRGPAVVTRVLSVLLVPWTILLALPSSARFFPGPAWQWGWVAFDLLLSFGLYQLSLRFRQPLADILVRAVMLDALVTAGQVLLFNLSHLRGPLDGVVALVAVSAPTLASVLLWNARAHRSLAAGVDANRSVGPLAG